MIKTTDRFDVRITKTDKLYLIPTLRGVITRELIASSAGSDYFYFNQAYKAMVDKLASAVEIEVKSPEGTWITIPVHSTQEDVTNILEAIKEVCVKQPEEEDKKDDQKVEEDPTPVEEPAKPDFTSDDSLDTSAPVEETVTTPVIDNEEETTTTTPDVETTATKPYVNNKQHSSYASYKATKK